MENIKEAGFITPKEIQFFSGCSMQESLAEFSAISNSLEKEKITMNNCLDYWTAKLEKKIDQLKAEQNALKILRNNTKGSVFITTKDIELVFAGQQDDRIKEQLYAHSEACKCFKKEHITILDWCIFIFQDINHLENLIDLLNKVRNNH